MGSTSHVFACQLHRLLSPDKGDILDALDKCLTINRTLSTPERMVEVAKETVHHIDIPALVDALAKLLSPSPTDQEPEVTTVGAFNILTTLASSQPFLDAFIKHPTALASTFGLFSWPHAQVRQKAVMAIGLISSWASPGSKRLIAEAGAIDHLMLAMKSSGDEGPRMDAAYGIWQLSISSSNRSKAMAEAGALKILSSLARTATLEFHQESVAGAMKSILSNIKRSRLHKSEAKNITEAMVQQMLHGVSAKASGRAMLALWSLLQLSSDPQENAAIRQLRKAAASTPDILPALAAVLKLPLPASVKTDAVSALVCLLELDPRAVTTAAGSGVADAAVGLLRQGDATAVIIAVSLLDRLLLYDNQGRIRRQARAAGVIDVLLQQLQQQQPGTPSCTGVAQSLGFFMSDFTPFTPQQTSALAAAVPVLLHCMAASCSQDGTTLYSITQTVNFTKHVLAPHPQHRAALDPIPAALVGLLRRDLAPSAAEVALRCLCEMVEDRGWAGAASKAGGGQVAQQMMSRPGVSAGQRGQAKRLHTALLGLPGPSPAAGGAVQQQEEPAAAAPAAASTSSSSSSPLSRCAACGAAKRGDGKALFTCSACSRAAYCSKACQMKHWKEHKVECVAGRTKGTAVIMRS